MSHCNRPKQVINSLHAWKNTRVALGNGARIHLWPLIAIQLAMRLLRMQLLGMDPPSENKGYLGLEPNINVCQLVCVRQIPENTYKYTLLILLAAGFAAKGLLILMTSSSGATGLAHSKLILWTDQMLTRREVFRQRFITLVGLWLLIGSDCCLCCDDVKKSTQIYGKQTKPKSNAETLVRIEFVPCENS